MKSIKDTVSYSWTVKKSTFLCHLIPCDQSSDIKSIIEHYTTKYEDATHNCIAYIVSSHQKAFDDGEPSGTAGLPMLDVLQKQEMNNIIAIVTRYFGGIKLGAGGLARAYRQSVANALQEATIIEKQLFSVYDITIPYSYTKKFEYILQSQQIYCRNKQYDSAITYTCYIADASFFTTVQELTRGSYHKLFIEEAFHEIQ